MSPSETAAPTPATTPPRKTGVMIVEGPAGVELQVLDGGFNLVARGSNRLTASLDEGVYVVKWIAGGKVHQEFHRLFAIAAPLTLPKEPLPAEISAGSLAETLPQGVAEVRESAEPWMHGEAEIVIFLRGVDGAASAAEIEALRLFNATDVAMRSDVEAAAREPSATESEDGKAARLYRVPRGDYRVRYESASGEAFEQSVPALPDRRTLVFLRLTASTSLVAAGKTFRRVERVGVNPAATRVVSILRPSTTRDNADQVRLAELVQHGLMSNASPLDPTTLAQLDDPATDPLLKISAAALIVLRLEQGVPPGLENEVFKVAATVAQSATEAVSPFLARLAGVLGLWRWISSLVDAETVRRRDADWRKHAARLVRSADPTWRNSDAIIMGWRLQGLGESWPVSPPCALQEPPMLNCCWRWAVAVSAVRPDAMPNTRSIRAPARGRVPAGPWLAWRATAAKELAFDTPATPQGDLGSVVASLNQAAETLELSAARKTELAGSLLSTLSVETRRIVANTQSLSLEGGTASEKLQRFAESLAAPTLVLQAQIEAARRELTGAAEEAPDARAASPALSRPITAPDDANKGRFGGLAAAKGFTLSASFDDRSPDWVKTTLVIAADETAGPTDGLSVDVFLHDSFRPNRQVATFEGRRAELEVRSWGGFTVGVWIPKRKVELELDLAELEGAPAAIRDL